VTASTVSANETLYRYRFGTAEFDEAAFELKVGGIPIEVQRKPLEILAILLRHAGEVVTKEELFDTVWPKVTTGDNVLTNAVNKLRNALGDANAQHIVTQPRAGYRFDGPVDRVAVGRSLVSVLDLKPGMKVPGRENFNLDRLIGRSPGSEVWTARQGKSGEIRVYKFSPDGERLAALKREATLSRVLRGSLGPRDDIARILDWNFETPPFFLECEFGGQNLAEWAAEGDRLRGMALPDRLGIFLQIADALSAAHGVGVLHKDLKPANILVAPRAEGWQIRLTDFGSGRLLEPSRLAGLGISLFGLTLGQGAASDSSSGTPLYLAPELIAGEAATVKTDVYALGLILYQIVTGDFRKPLIPGWERDIADPLLREDIAEATDGDPARRLDSAAELARRLRTLDARRLERQRVEDAEAAARSAAEAIKRSRARRPWLIGTFAALALGLAASIVLYFQIRRTADRLAAEVETSRTLTRFLTDDLIAAADPRITGRSDVTVAEAARSAAAKIDTTFKSSPPEIRAALHIQMAKAFMGLTDYQAAVSEGDLALAALRAENEPEDRAIDDAELTTVEALVQLSKLPEAEARLKAMGHFLESSDSAGSELEVRYWTAKGWLAAGTLNLPEVVDAAERSWAAAKPLPDTSIRLRDGAEFDLADAYRLSGRLTESEFYIRDLIEKQTSHYGVQDVRSNFSAVLLASVLGSEKKFDEALQLLNRVVPIIENALGSESMRTMDANSIMAGIYYEKKNYDRAASIWGEVANVEFRKTGDVSLYYLVTQNNIGMARRLGGETSAAERIFRVTLEKAETRFATTDPLVEGIRYNLATCLLDLHRAGEVAELLNGLTPEALKMSELEPDWEGRLAYQRGRLALQQGNLSEARSLLANAAKLIGPTSADGSITQDMIQAQIQQANDSDAQTAH
jgi:non-specific serine/threonine protein kinase